MKGKVNPRRIPATLADVEKAKERGRAEGISGSIVVFFTVLLDKYGETAEDLQKLWKQINELSDSIEKGYVSLYDLQNVLAEEYEISIN